MPSINGLVEVNLTVRDPGASADWYRRVLGMEVRYDHTSDDGRLRYVSLVEPGSGLILCVVGHADNPGDPFSELRTGLDHLDALGVAHSGVKELGYTPNSMVTFRDPDNIQLELFWRAPVVDAEG